MGIATFLITATVEGILAQRLVRRICTQCREPAAPSAELLQDLELTAADVADKTYYRGRGCDACNNTGYKGRVGLFELMLMNDDLRDMIMRNASTDELREAARSIGMVTLRDAGMLAAAEGRTTLDEVVRETILEA
jgi:type IV pilus assembly protein PilB